MNQEYTFTFEQADEKRFNTIKDRLDPEEYEVIEETHLVNPDQGRYSEMATKIAMDPEAASTFRFGMKQLKIRRTRNEEELAEEKAQEEKNTVTITVKVDGLPTP